MRLIDADAFEKENQYFWNLDFINPKYGETLADLINAAPTIEIPEQKQEKWYPLGNWMPEKEVLAFNNKQGSYGYHEYLIGYIREDAESSTGFSCDNESEILMNVTHWMPLPEPPREED